MKLFYMNHLYVIAMVCTSVKGNLASLKENMTDKSSRLMKVRYMGKIFDGKVSYFSKDKSSIH